MFACKAKIVMQMFRPGKPQTIEQKKGKLTFDFFFWILSLTFFVVKLKTNFIINICLATSCHIAFCSWIYCEEFLN